MLLREGGEAGQLAVRIGAGFHENDVAVLGRDEQAVPNEQRLTMDLLIIRLIPSAATRPEERRWGRFWPLDVRARNTR